MWLGPYNRVLGVGFRSSCLIAFLGVGCLCLSHNEVKWAVGFFYGFVFAIASAPCGFLYLNNEYMIKRKKPPISFCYRLVLSLLFLIFTYGREIFTPWAHAFRTMSSFWHKAQRRMTNCCLCTRTGILAIEACLHPLNLLLS